MVGLTLLAEARAAGLTVLADHGRLIVRGPREAEPLAHQLLAHKAEVLNALATEQRNGEYVVPWERCHEWRWPEIPFSAISGLTTPRPRR